MTTKPAHRFAAVAAREQIGVRARNLIEELTEDHLYCNVQLNPRTSQPA